MSRDDLSEYQGRGYNMHGTYLVGLSERFRPVFTPCSAAEYVAMGKVIEQRAAESNSRCPQLHEVCHEAG